MHPVFWICGNSRSASKAWRAILKKMGEDTHVESLYCGYNPENTSSSLVKYACAGDVISLLKHRDIFDSGRRIVRMVGLPEDYSLLSDYLHLVNDNNVLVILSSFGYKSHSSNRWSSALSSKLYKAIQSDGRIFDFPFEATSHKQACEWIVDVVSETAAEWNASFENKTKISEPACDKLVELCGYNLDCLTNESIKLVTYKYPFNIDLCDVEESCFSKSDVVVWDLISCLDDKNTEKALCFLEQIYRNCYTRNDNLYSAIFPVLSAIMQHFMFLMFLKDVCPDGISVDIFSEFVADFMKIPINDESNKASPWFSKQFIYANINKSHVKKAYQWSKKYIYECLNAIEKCIYMTRIYSSDDAHIKVLFSVLTMYLCGNRENDICSILHDSR